MTARGLKAACLAMPGAVEEFPFSRYPELSTFKVAGKIFALSALGEDPLTVSLKCDPEIAGQLRAEYPSIIPGYHLNKRHWNTVALDGSLPARMVREMIEDSYDLVVASLPRAVRLTYDSS
ncbi:MmcQ/YjbR family DNA-binding protein [Streptomyces sp. H10-C2]|uniref:MmcQ/YjbR family DNA-binding protein n=1 Tax=unclassified Streptomyces TaxID=2593676 RepID=UPI0024BA54D7|nr:MULTISPECIES: MmcQ/YjbR family DNA-binding protein [unclassified Streptomyces]MDJ0342104.1 MmcQ/YjbR family DNA-binding protein [Streptomyces sp. PH10-H1]MDJ0368446.1 MmcQ/YjbR family DNA-binding protein [Streptomyces sp. H10-C2]